MKKLSLLLALLLILSGCGGDMPAQTAPEPVQTTLAPTEAPTTEPVTEPEPTLPPDQHFILTFAGDCTFGSQDATWYAPWGFVKTVGEDYGYPFRNVADIFAADEFTMVNLEGVLGDATGAIPKAHNLHGPAEFVKILTVGSVEAVTLANNHTQDYGDEGYGDTRAILEGEGIPYVERQKTLLHTTASGLTIGVYAEEYTNMNMELLTESVAALRQAGAEVIVYALHWGKEYSYYPQPDQMDWAHRAMDAGVDILYGTHPHVLQLYEEYNGKPIFYSLGNFSFGGNMYPGDLDSAIAQVEVIRRGDGTVSLGEITLIPVSISSIPERNNFQPTPCEAGSEQYQRILDKLAGLWKGRDSR